MAAANRRIGFQIKPEMTPLSIPTNPGTLPVIKGKQCVAVLGEAVGGFLVFQPVAFNEGVEGFHGLGPRLGHPDLLQCTLGFGLLALRQLAQDIRRFVNPAALLSRRRPNLAERLPETQPSVGNRELRCGRQAATLQIEQQLAPVLRAFPCPIREANQLLLSFRRRTDEDEDALLLVFEPRLQIDAVRPDIDVTAGGEIAPLPPDMLVCPELLQSRDRSGR